MKFVRFGFLFHHHWFQINFRQFYWYLYTRGTYVQGYLYPGISCTWGYYDGDVTVGDLVHVPLADEPYLHFVLLLINFSMLSEAQ
jgi:hypothetical protein